MNANELLLATIAETYAKDPAPNRPYGLIERDDSPLYHETIQKLRK